MSWDEALHANRVPALLPQEALQYSEKPVPDERRRCSGEELFDWLAETLLDFAAEQGWCGDCFLNILINYTSYEQDIGTCKCRDGILHNGSAGWYTQAPMLRY